MKKLQTFDSSYFRGKNHFENYGTQNYLVFQPMIKYFKNIGMLIIFQNGDLGACPMKLLNLLVQLIIVLRQHKIIMVTKSD